MGREDETLRFIQAQAWWWLNVKQAVSKFLAKVVYKEQDFNFFPYSYTPRVITKALLFKEHNGEINLVP